MKWMLVSLVAAMIAAPVAHAEHGDGETAKAKGGTPALLRPIDEQGGWPQAKMDQLKKIFPFMDNAHYAKLLPEAVKAAQGGQEEKIAKTLAELLRPFGNQGLENAVKIAKEQLKAENDPEMKAVLKRIEAAEPIKLYQSAADPMKKLSKESADPELQAFNVAFKQANIDEERKVDEIYKAAKRGDRDFVQKNVSGKELGNWAAKYWGTPYQKDVSAILDSFKHKAENKVDPANKMSFIDMDINGKAVRAWLGTDGQHTEALGAILASKGNFGAILPKWVDQPTTNMHFSNGQWVSGIPNGAVPPVRPPQAGAAPKTGPQPQQQPQGTQPPQTSPSLNGAALVGQKCNTCHGSNRSPYSSNAAGAARVADGTMPPGGLPPAEKAAVLQFLQAP